MKTLRILFAAGVLATAGGAQAAVVEKTGNGFRLKSEAQIAAPPEKVWKALGEIGKWWSDDHTYSAKASNLSMPLTAGACFCEALPDGGGVRHGVVALVIPKQQLRVEAALGPLQDEGAGGALAFQLTPKEGGTHLVMTYNVGGARDFIVAAAPGVDAVMTDGFARLKSYVETGKPK